MRTGITWAVYRENYTSCFSEGGGSSSMLFNQCGMRANTTHKEMMRTMLTKKSKMCDVTIMITTQHNKYILHVHTSSNIT